LNEKGEKIERTKWIEMIGLINHTFQPSCSSPFGKSKTPFLNHNQQKRINQKIKKSKNHFDIIK